jgi:DNA-binding MarR family transcriptional regulator
MQKKNTKARMPGTIDTPPDLVKQIIHQIRRMIQAKELYTKELHKNYAITAAQLNCLLALHENGRMPPSQIAKLIMVKSSTVTGIVDRLEIKGLVVRSRSSSDRRVINIELTDAGIKLAHKAPPPIQQKILDALKELPEKDLKGILKSLSILTRALDVQDLPVE